jgi:hypothetical protein
MSSAIIDPDSPEVFSADIDTQLDAFIDHHRAGLGRSLDGLTEEEAQRSLVPSKTTLLGLVKHAAFVERVWFQEARTGRSRSELGIPTGPDESFTITPEDTIVSVVADFTAACEDSRSAALGVPGDTLWSGNRRGQLTLRWIRLHVLREHAQHCGHADILREQILAGGPEHRGFAGPADLG